LTILHLFICCFFVRYKEFCINCYSNIAFKHIMIYLCYYNLLCILLHAHMSPLSNCISSNPYKVEQYKIRKAGFHCMCIRADMLYCLWKWLLVDSVWKQNWGRHGCH
jgi:hypothetical protein